MGVVPMTNFVYSSYTLRIMEITTMCQTRAYDGSSACGLQEGSTGAWFGSVILPAEKMAGQDKAAYKPCRFWNVLFFTFYKLKLSHFMSYHQGCNYPPIIAHGHYEKTSSYLSIVNKVKYECDKGYMLHGQATLSCSSSRWSHEAPQCKGNSSSPFSPWLSGWNCRERIESSFFPARGSMETFDLIYFT